MSKVHYGPRSETRLVWFQRNQSLQQHSSIISANLKGGHPLVKFMATHGPASSDSQMIGLMMDAGQDVARFNLSHATTSAERSQLVQMLFRARCEANKRGRQIACVADLKGPEFRTGHREDLSLNPGERVRLTTRDPAIVASGDGPIIFVTPPLGYDLLRDLRGNGKKSETPKVLIDDGQIELHLKGWPHVFDPEHPETDFFAVVKDGGVVHYRKGINFSGVSLPSLPSLVQEDREALAEIFDPDFLRQACLSVFEEEGLDPKILGVLDRGKLLALGFDFVAPSFVRLASDLQGYSDLLQSMGVSHVKFIPKIETVEAVEEKNLDAILQYPLNAAVMIARGDLSDAVGRPNVPRYTRLIMKGARKVGLAAILATDVFPSLSQGAHQLSRSDADALYSALVKGIDLVMFSNETAVSGKNPPADVIRLVVEAVNARGMELATCSDEMRGDQQRRVMSCMADRLRLRGGESVGIEAEFQAYLHMMTAAALMEAERVVHANGVFVGGMILWSHKGGDSMRYAAQLNPSLPVYVVTDDLHVAREGALLRSIFPILVRKKPRSSNELAKIVASVLPVPEGQDKMAMMMVSNL